MNNLKKYRCQNNLTQTDLANKLGITKAAIAIYESPKYRLKPGKEISAKLAKIFNCSVIELCGWDNFFNIPETKEDKLFLINLLQSSLNQDEKEV